MFADLHLPVTHPPLEMALLALREVFTVTGDPDTHLLRLLHFRSRRLYIAVWPGNCLSTANIFFRLSSLAHCSIMIFGSMAISRKVTS